MLLIQVDLQVVTVVTIIHLEQERNGSQLALMIAYHGVMCFMNWWNVPGLLSAQIPQNSYAGGMPAVLELTDPQIYQISIR